MATYHDRRNTTNNSLSLNIQKLSYPIWMEQEIKKTGQGTIFPSNETSGVSFLNKKANSQVWVRDEEG